MGRFLTLRALGGVIRTVGTPADGSIAEQALFSLRVVAIQTSLTCIVVEMFLIIKYGVKLAGAH